MADLASLLVVDPLAQDHGLKLGMLTRLMTKEGGSQSYTVDPRRVLGKDDKGGGVRMPVPNDDVAGWLDGFALVDLGDGEKTGLLLVQVVSSR